MFILTHKGKQHRVKNVLSKEFLDIAFGDYVDIGANVPGVLRLEPYQGGGSSFYDVYASHPGWSLHPDLDILSGGVVMSTLGPTSLDFITSAARWTANKDTTLDGMFLWLSEVRGIARTPSNLNLTIYSNTLYGSAKLAVPIALKSGDSVTATFQINGSVSL